MTEKKDSPTPSRGGSAHVQERFGNNGGPGLAGQGMAESQGNRTKEGGQMNASSEDEPGVAGQIVGRHPYPSVLAGFGLGFGFGVMLTMILRERQPTWTEKYVPESLQHFPDRLKHLPESLGSYVPSSWRHS